MATVVTRLWDSRILWKQGQGYRDRTSKNTQSSLSLTRVCFSFNKHCLKCCKPLTNFQSSEKGFATVLVNLMDNLIFSSFYSAILEMLLPGDFLWLSQVWTTGKSQLCIEKLPGTWPHICHRLPCGITASRMCADYRTLGFLGHISCLIHTRYLF